MKKLFLLLIFLTGCAMGGKMRKLNGGMMKEEVLSLLGKPDGIKHYGEYEHFTYSHRLMSSWSWDRADYNVILKNDKVVDYGTGEVRVKDRNVILLVPVP